MQCILSGQRKRSGFFYSQRHISMGGRGVWLSCFGWRVAYSCLLFSDCHSSRIENCYHFSLCFQRSKRAPYIMHVLHPLRVVPDPPRHLAIMNGHSESSSRVIDSDARRLPHTASDAADASDASSNRTSRGAESRIEPRV